MSYRRYRIAFALTCYLQCIYGNGKINTTENEQMTGRRHTYVVVLVCGMPLFIFILPGYYGIYTETT